MVKIYTKLDNVRPIVQDNEAFFRSKVAVRHISSKGRKYLEDIDRAVIIDEKVGTLMTPFGVIPLDSISTGAKTIQNLMYLQKYDNSRDIEVTECGANALDIIFELMDNYDGDVRILLRHAMTARCGKRQYIVNDTRVIQDGAELSGVLMEEMCI